MKQLPYSTALPVPRTRLLYCISCAIHPVVFVATDRSVPGERCNIFPVFFLLFIGHFKIQFTTAHQYFFHLRCIFYKIIIDQFFKSTFGEFADMAEGNRVTQVCFWRKIDQWFTETPGKLSAQRMETDLPLL
jgi:uncharacterized membrane protein